LDGEFSRPDGWLIEFFPRLIVNRPRVTEGLIHLGERFSRSDHPPTSLTVCMSVSTIDVGVRKAIEIGFIAQALSHCL
jgi:hypothetical protein